VSETNLSDPQLRATHNNWYLYHDTSRIHGPDGYVRAIIEEARGEMVAGDGGAVHTYRRAFVSAVNMRDTNPDEWDQLDETLEAMSDGQFHDLIDKGTAIPLSAPK
jgi:hypothetical protein